MVSETVLAPWSSRLLGVLRIVSGLLFIQHGTAKLFGVPTSMGEIPLASLIGVAGIIEVVGGALFIIGLFTRPVAFILSGLCAFAYFIGHAAKGTGAAHERRRARDRLLLHVPLLRRGRRRRVERYSMRARAV